MRTTIRLDDQLLAEIKQLANQSEKTMTAIIEEALRLMIAQRKQSAKRTPIKLITFDGNGGYEKKTLDHKE